MHKHKQGQISIEILYAVGVLLLLFIMVSGVSFNRNITTERTKDFIDKRNDCYKLADKLNGLSTMNNNVTSLVKIRHEAEIFDNGLIIVGDPVAGAKEVEAHCTFTGTLFDNYTKSSGTHRITRINNKLVIS